MKQFSTRFLLALLFGASFGLSAQTPTQIADIFSGSEDSSPRNFFPVGDQFLFRAETENEGVEPWISDGTPEGTRLLLDINTDPDLSRGNSNPDNFTFYNGRVYFKARAAGLGDELWATDGTSAGTVLVKDIQPGEGNGNPFDFIVYNGLLYFTANDGTNSSELWVSDGTEAGTQLVVDIQPGDAPGNPNFKTIYNGMLFFTANDGVNGNELWMSDGTAAGTTLVKDIRDGGNSSPSRYIEYENELYFRANDGVNGTELWKTDGTEAGTVLVRDIREGSSSASPSNFFVTGGALYFGANDGNGTTLWETLGDSATTTQVLEALSGNPIESPRSALDITPGLETLVVGSTDTTDVFYVGFPFQGTFVFISLEEILDGLEGDDPEDLVYTGSRVYFSYENNARGREIASIALSGLTDAEPAAEVAPGMASGDIDDIFLFGNQLIFEATDGTSGDELWTLDAGTSYVFLFDPANAQLSVFDTIDVGAVSPGFTASSFATVANLGTDTITFSFENTAEVAAPFSASLRFPGTENDNGIIPPGPDFNRIEVDFTPTEAGVFLDSALVFFSTAAGPTGYQVYFRGEGVLPSLEVADGGALLTNPGSIDFNDVPERTDSTRTVTLTNAGLGQLVIDSVSLTFDTVFTVVSVTDTLEAGESVSVPVTFTGTMIGNYTDVLTVYSSDTTAGGLFVVDLNGAVIINSITELGIPARAVYPNPVASELTVELEEALNAGAWRVFDNTGRLLKQGLWPAGQQIHQLPLAELKPGLYQVEVSDGSRRVVARVVKQ